MKLNDFIKQEPTPKKSGYKVVVGNTPKEQELEKQASQAAVLESSLTAANLKVDELERVVSPVRPKFSEIAIRKRKNSKILQISNGLSEITNNRKNTLVP